MLFGGFLPQKESTTDANLEMFHSFPGRSIVRFIPEALSLKNQQKQQMARSELTLRAGEWPVTPRNRETEEEGFSVAFQRSEEGGFMLFVIL